MDWLKVLTIAGSTLGAVWFMHREYCRETKSFHAEMKGFYAETKDFHGRLCRLEEKYIQMMQSSLERKKK